MDMATDADINIEHRLTEVEQRAKSNTNRLNEHDEILKSNSEMIGAIKELATEVKYMRGDLNETVERLNKLEGKDGDKWDKFKWLIVTGLVTLILGYLAVSVQVNVTGVSPICQVIIPSGKIPYRESNSVQEMEMLH